MAWVCSHNEIRIFFKNPFRMDSERTRRTERPRMSCKISIEESLKTIKLIGVIALDRYRKEFSKIL